MITSMANSKVKRLAALAQKAKARREENCFVVEGIRMFREAPPDWIREVYVSETFIRKHGSELRCSAPFEVLADAVFQKASDTQTPQGILCVLSMPRYELAERLAGDSDRDTDTAKAPLYMLLEDLQDPGNVGTILRAGEGAGIDGVIMTRQTADLFNPKVIRATMGSIYRVPFFIVDALTDTIDLLREKGVAVYAAHLDDSVDYDVPDYTQPTAFLIGNEGNGLRRETAQRAAQYIKIPMAGQVESLNAAMASAVLMYEAARQRRTKTKI